MTKKTSKPKAKKIKAADAASTTEAAAPKVSRDHKNGITRPGEGKCAAVWAACEALKAEGKELAFEALRAVVDSKTADATIRTQRQRFRQYVS